MTHHNTTDPPEKGPPAAHSGLQWAIPSAPEGPDGHPFCIPDQERYLPGAEVGVGGMGRVYTAQDQRLHRQVAIKAVREDAPGDAAQRLAQEAWITAQLDHPGIVSVYDAGQTPDGRPFYVMRLVRGQSLADAIAQARTPLARSALLRHFLAACQAVAYAHNMGIIHRDLKPSNILVGGFGETQVMDWGLARPVQRTAGSGWSSVVPAAHVAETQQGVAVGTPRYMSPEQASGGGVDPRSDVWSLGVVLYEILAGAPPYTGDTPQAVLEKVATQPPSPLTGAPPELAAVVARALSRDPARRYPDAGALAADVARFLDGRPVEVYTYSPTEVLLRFLSAWRLPLGVGLLIAAAAMVLVGSAWRSTLSAEHAAQEARRRSDESLQRVLITQARVALGVDARAEAEILAANALTFGDSPEAWGVLASFAATPRPRLLARAPLPDCEHTSLSGDGQRILCVHQGEISLRDQQGARIRWTRPAPANVNRILLNVDGTRGVIDANERHLWIIDGADGSMLPLDRTQDNGLPERTIFSQNPRWVGAFNTYLALVVDLETGVLQEIHRCPGGTLGSVALSAAGLLAQVCDGEGLVLQDLLGGAPERIIPNQIASGTGHQGPWVGAFSPEGDHVAIGALDGRVELVSLTQGRSIAATRMGEGMIRAIAVSAGGASVIAAAERGGTRLWHPERADPMLRLPGHHSQLLFQTDGSLLTVGHERSRWAPPPPSAATRLDFSAGVSGVVFSPDGRGLLVTTGQDAQVWSTQEAHRTALWTPREDRVTKDAAFTLDGQEALVASMAVNGIDRLSVHSGAPLPTLSWSAPIRRVGVLGADLIWGLPWTHGPILWDRRSGEPNSRLSVPNARMFEGEGSFNGAFAAMISQDRAVYRLLAAPTPTVERLLTDTSAHAIDISEDGQRVILADEESIWVVDVARRETVLTIPSPGRMPLDIALSQDGQHLAAGDLLGGARIWSVADGSLQVLLRGHNERVVGVAFSPDGRFLATGSWDEQVRLWGLDVLQQEPQTLVREIEGGWGMTLEQALASEIW